MPVLIGRSPKWGAWPRDGTVGRVDVGADFLLGSVWGMTRHLLQVCCGPPSWVGWGRAGVKGWWQGGEGGARSK